MAVLLGSVACSSSKKKEGGEEPAHLAFRTTFGCCNHSDASQSFWSKILKKNPNVWVWLGGAVEVTVPDLTVFQMNYKWQLEDPDYKTFRSQVKITGTWGESDYGSEDGTDFVLKNQSRSLFWDFMEIPAADALRAQSGVYRSETWTVVGNKVKLVMLDEQSFRPSANKTHTIYDSTDDDLLGAAQWAWLEKEIADAHDAKVLLVASGMKALDAHSYEKWKDFPKSRERLMKILESSSAKVKIVLSGNRALGEFGKINFNPDHPENVLYSLTSSALTQSFSGAALDGSRNLLPQTNYGVLDFLLKDQNFVIDAYLVDLETGNKVADMEIPIVQSTEKEK